MNYEASQLIEQRLNDNYLGSIKIIRPNAPTRREPENSRFARFSVDFIRSDNIGIGAVRSRTTGMIIVELFVPLGEGDRTALQQMEDFGNVFRNQDFSGIMCYERSIDIIGAVTLEGEDLRRFKVECRIPFYFDRVA